jgi:ubiquinone/menaquinone biosynthesis C-methylase UbiE
VTVVPKSRLPHIETPEAAYGQDRAAAAKNESYFGNVDRYEARKARLQTYRNIRAAIEEHVVGQHRLLDVGSGGAFEYDPGSIGEVVAVDLFLDDVGAWRWPNVRRCSGDALALPIADGAVDVVLVAMLLHHLVGPVAESVVRNTRQALHEAARVLRPGGRLVIAESVVPSWMYRFELRSFGMLRRLAATPLMKHPPTLQLTADVLVSTLPDDLRPIRSQRIEIGRWILQFGHTWPTALTPARPYLVVAEKQGSRAAPAEQ